MTLLDFVSFTSLTLILVGSFNWMTVAVRYAANDLPSVTDLEKSLLTNNSSKHDVYKVVPTPDLLALLGAHPIVQMIIYWTVGAAGIVYLMLFIFNSIEFRSETA